jgi:hypothetical protein
MAGYTDLEFQKMFRMCRESFQKLQNLIEPYVATDVFQGSRSSGSSITSTTKLAVTLRWLAGGAYQDIASLFGVSIMNFFHPRGPLWTTFDAIDKAIKLGFSLKQENLRQTASEFSRYSHGRLKDCVMAIDGWVCKTRQPSVKEAGISTVHWRNRKKCFAIVVLAGCDAQCRFTFWDANNSGSSHDAGCWERSNLRHIFNDLNGLPLPYYVIGDEAFANTKQFLVPWGGQNLQKWKDSFNYHLSAMRQCIERAFGRLVKRWGIFWRPLSFRFDKWATVTMVCAKLHNFCIENADRDPPIVHSQFHYSDEGFTRLDNNEREEAVAASTGATRRNLTLMLEASGITRPAFAMTNSRE